MRKSPTKRRLIYSLIHDSCRIHMANKGCKECLLSDLRVCDNLESIPMSRLREAETRISQKIK